MVSSEYMGSYIRPNERSVPVDMKGIQLNGEDTELRIGLKHTRLTIIGGPELRKARVANKDGGTDWVMQKQWKCKCSCKALYGEDIVWLTAPEFLGNKKGESCGCLREIRRKGQPKRIAEAIAEGRMMYRNALKIRTRAVPGYSAWVSQVLSQGVCRKCGFPGSEDNGLEAHHINGYASHPEGRVDPSNGACLCEVCHKAFHRDYGTKGATAANFAEFLVR